MKKLLLTVLLIKGFTCFGQVESVNDNYWQIDTAEYRRMLDSAVKIIEWYDGKSVLIERPISDLYKNYIMGAKEKAKELVEKFLKEIPHSEYSLPLLAAQQCALIAVEELIKSWDEDLYKDCGASEYWQQVKAEIEKM